MSLNIKKIFVLLTAFIFCVGLASGQEKKPEKHSEKIADAMKDSLHLNKKQRDQIYTINMKLYDEKTKARKLSSNRAVVGHELQRIENTRDKLYKNVLKDQEFEVYKKKKGDLVKKH